MRTLFLPGASGDGRFWAPLARRLDGPRESVLLDWPGLGHVPADPRVQGLDDLVGLVLARMDVAVDLVAQSMGGVVALLAALARPERVRRLVLAATSGGIDTTPFAPADRRPDYAREFPDAAPWIGEVHADLGGRLRAVTAPALLLWGDADPISPPAIGRRLAQLLPDARLVIIPGGDHMFARDRAAEVAPHVAAHFDAG